ncbi:MAG: D-3-phosphoglycerate dehydrogenase [Ktedonobacterales bacterium]|jgi:phosphoglycerate dehydrogenase-like enzyme|nr:MAG: D-3-phosphoglycerate dehydrogenase [Ktedonobacterales bacterium]
MGEPHTQTIKLLVTDFTFTSADRQRLIAALGPDVLLHVQGYEALRQALAAHPETDLLCSFHPPADTLSLAPGLRWIQLPSAGADHALRDHLVRDDGPIVTTANGVHTVPISEFVFSLLLLWAHRWPEFFALQQAEHWPDHAQWVGLRGRELRDATLGIIGLGAIGRQVARLGRAFGMRLLGTRRSARAADTDPDLDQLIPLAQLHHLLAQSDYIVLAAPSTSDSHHLIGPAELHAMKPTAFLINISRGDLIDQDALITALRERQIAGAGLDVFAQEPLPPESPLWRMPNVLISPHISGASDHYSRRFTDLYLDNIRRYRAGEPLVNVVNAQRGY